MFARIYPGNVCTLYRNSLYKYKTTCHQVSTVNIYLYRTINIKICNTSNCLYVSICHKKKKKKKIKKREIEAQTKLTILLVPSRRSGVRSPRLGAREVVYLKR